MPCLVLCPLAFLLVYLFGSLPFMSYQTFSGGPAWRVRGGGEMFLQQLPMSAWLFVGNESINSVANVVVQPKKVLPGCQIDSMLTLFATSIGVMPPGVDKLQDELVVIRRGITTMFRTSDAVATILSIPATFATIFGFQVDATGVGLLRPEHQTHPVAACAGSAVGLICYFLADAFPAAFTLFNTSMIFGFAVNLAQCWNHRFMCVNFKHLARCYRSPLRTFGSGFAAVMWIVHLVALLGFQPSSEASLCIVASTIVLLTILYPLVVRAHQTLSPDEEKVMLFAHITKRTRVNTAAFLTHV
ncbi:unnamed protein product [Aphanomyces euteiches]